MTELDIISTSTDTRAVALSNLSPWQFTMEGVQCNSMEGFLQSLKVSDSALQQKLCLMIGKAAMREGQKYNDWKDNQFLYWQNRVFPRESQQYSELLHKAYRNLCDQNVEWSDILKSTYPLILTHTVGKSNHKDTILTSKEFCDILSSLRLTLMWNL